IRVKDCKDTGNVLLYLFSGSYYMGCAKQACTLTCEIAEKAECPVFTFGYYLNPKYQFSAQLCDAVAAYLYLINLSLWVDLTSSMPSFLEPEMDKTDHISKFLAFLIIGSPCPMSIEYLKHVKIVSERIKQKKLNVVGHSSFSKFPRIKLYCTNKALAIPYISP
ncbi:7968_t:CDS:2, partial [Dentiscutata heterogama]